MGLIQRLLFLLPHAACSQASCAPLLLARDAVDLFLSRLLENVITAIKIYYLIIGAASSLIMPCMFYWIESSGQVLSHFVNVPQHSVLLSGGCSSSVSKIWAVGAVYHRQIHNFPLLGPILRGLSTSNSPAYGIWSCAVFFWATHKWLSQSCTVKDSQWLFRIGSFQGLHAWRCWCLTAYVQVNAWCSAPLQHVLSPVSPVNPYLKQPCQHVFKQNPLSDLSSAL